MPGFRRLRNWQFRGQAIRFHAGAGIQFVKPAFSQTTLIGTASPFSIFVCNPTWLFPMKMTRCLLLAGLLSMLPVSCIEAEVFSGDFSDDNLSPTNLEVLGLGIHQVTGGVTGPNAESTDFFSSEIG